MYNGLSLDQAPPISVVLRFFLTVPFFGLFVCAILVSHPEFVLVPNHPVSLSVIHLMFLGVVSMSMIGALFQMQSVLGGRPIPAPSGNAFLIHLFLTFGTLSLGGAFYFMNPIGFVVASVFLGSAILYTVKLVLPLLFGGNTHDTLRGMRMALIALSVSAILGLVMASGYANETLSESHGAIRTIHYSFALIGWVGALIIAVAFQVIEMFYVTQPYNGWCKRNVFPLLALMLALKTVGVIFQWPIIWVFDGVIGALLLGFALITFKRLTQRKRRVSDVSIWYWMSGIALLSLSLIAYPLSLISGNEVLTSLSLMAFGLFALAIILAMMGKIVPFLVWFHLNSAGYMDAPIMSNIIPQNFAKGVFWLFLITVGMMLGGVAVSPLLMIGGVSGGAMFILLGFNVIRSVRIYRYTLIYGKRFEQM
jgi:hypothetical protein